MTTLREQTIEKIAEFIISKTLQLYDGLDNNGKQFILDHYKVMVIQMLDDIPELAITKRNASPPYLNLTSQNTKKYVKAMMDDGWIKEVKE